MPNPASTFQFSCGFLSLPTSVGVQWCENDFWQRANVFHAPALSPAAAHSKQGPPQKVSLHIDNINFFIKVIALIFISHHSPSVPLTVVICREFNTFYSPSNYKIANICLSCPSSRGRFIFTCCWWLSPLIFPPYITASVGFVRSLVPYQPTCPQQSTRPPHSTGPLPFYKYFPATIFF